MPAPITPITLTGGPADGLTVPDSTTPDVVWIRVRAGLHGLEPVLDANGHPIWLRPDEWAEDLIPDWISYTRRQVGTWRYKPWPRRPVPRPRSRLHRI